MSDDNSDTNSDQPERDEGAVESQNYDLSNAGVVGLGESVAAIRNENAEAEAGDDVDDVDEFERLLFEVEADPGCAAFPRLAEAYRRDGQIARALLVAEQGLARAPERLGGRVALALAQLETGEIANAIQGLSSILENIPEVLRGTHAEVTEVSEPESARTFSTSMEVIDEPDADIATQNANEAEAAPDPTFEPEQTAWEHRLYAVPLAEPSALLPQVDPDRDGDDSAVELREDEIDRAFDSAEADADQMISANLVAEAAMLNVDDALGADELNDEYRVSRRPVFATETMANLLEGQGDLDAADEIRSSIPQVDVTAHEGEEAATSSVAIVTSSEENEQDQEQDEFTLHSYENEVDFGSESPAASESELEVSAAADFDAGDQPALELEEAPRAEATSEEGQKLWPHAGEELMSVTSAPEIEQSREDDSEPDQAIEVELDVAMDQGVVQDINDARAQRRARIVSRLEGWLANIRRDVA